MVSVNSNTRHFSSEVSHQVPAIVGYFPENFRFGALMWHLDVGEMNFTLL
jgi:hypothetical protein